eukprot:g4892.t1
MSNTTEKKSDVTQSSGGVLALSYAKDWTPEYLSTAEFELVVQKQLLPVHKHVLSMSPFFQKELFKTESKKSLLNAALKKKEDARVSTRLKLTSPLFQDTSVEDMCLLLCHVYATEAQLSVDRMDELRKLFVMTEDFGFPSLTRRCVNFIRNTDGIGNGIQTDLETNEATAATEWLDLAVKWDFPQVKDLICQYTGENFFDIYGRQEGTEPSSKWADLVMTLDSSVELWKRVARSQANRIESGPSLASLISDEASTTLIYGVLAGILAGSILPTWMFFLILIGTGWYVFNRMPPALTIVIQKTIEGAMQGVFHGSEGKENDPLLTSIENKRETEEQQKKFKKPPTLRRSSRITV